MIMDKDSWKRGTPLVLPHPHFHLRVRHFLPLHKPSNSEMNLHITMANSIITFSFVIFVSTFVAANGILGGRSKITDVNTNKEIQDLGRYSVEEYNRLHRSGTVKNGGDLTFYRVMEAEKQVVSGMKYYLKIQAFSKTSGDPKVFEAVVVVKPWLRSKQLLKFAPSPAAAISQLVW
ncbi:Cystatin [Cynara cardunculus var. scolymus]|uniref:Cystatin n=2 Tax=Cynara cardunculus var. scolymus TaxID=59895 RepID=A0A103Y0M8_CYNCS|nr:Cystatin [Cynara cardunculus var. scolymus]